ncbi:hypothetical protein U2F26_34565 [Micromonospora sp. 4G57]|uniref:Uncharacterized protein n=1 Tax=Micromonospora sicca TaxID=2202420 RepID=A0ABU5JPA8_9ACTN|nr:MULTISPECIES: hypothetical protein [unclassified Micromonospora]MDZ5447772.1 hypothetical protein [Micromonospora sp. 4G57]MDZ5494483.1 hypothetical protein [Micromonospora sp. 4G53]
MTEYSRGPFAQQYLTAFLAAHLDGPAAPASVLEAFSRVAHQPWQDGTPYVLAPAMTAVIAAAAQALDVIGGGRGCEVCLSLPTGRQRAWLEFGRHRTR